MKSVFAEHFLDWVELKPETIPSFETYPYSLPAVRKLGRLEFHPAVTFFTGENGTGKSTLLEAVAVALGFNAEGGSRNFHFATRATHSELHTALRIARGIHKPRTEFFLRAESFYNVATEVENLGMASFYGGKSLHEQSHGESFWSLVMHRFGPDGLYFLDEPESALSATRQMALLVRMRELVALRCQFIIATHSPILLAYPDALIHRFSDDGVESVSYEETDAYCVTRRFLEDRRGMLASLFQETGEHGINDAG